MTPNHHPEDVPDERRTNVSGGRAAVKVDGVDPNVAECLRDRAADQVRAGLAPGVQLYVSLHGTVVVDEAVGTGLPDGRPLTRDTRLCAWSASKPVTAMALHQLVERGLVTYADPVSRHVPELNGEGRESITVRHLLLHQAGIPDLEGRVTAADHGDRATLLERICSLPLEYEPGTQVVYHPLTAFALLAEVVSRVDGRAFDDYCTQEILEPLGMAHSSWGLSSELRSEASAQISTEDAVVMDLCTDGLCTGVVPGAGLWTTAADLGRFYECWRQGGVTANARLLSRATVQLATRRHAPILDLPRFGFGYGFMVGTAPEANPSRGVLCSERTFGHPGAQCAVAFCDPVHDLVVVVLANGCPPQPESDRRLGILCDEVYRALV
jgi:CubicO group peptidase (beta-lactamase class C family)